MTKINWKKRMKNKVWLLAFIAAIVGFAYTLCSMIGITPRVDESSVMDLVKSVLAFLVAIGVIVDPTTSGVGDSDTVLLEDAPVQATDTMIDESTVAETAESEAKDA